MLDVKLSERVVTMFALENIQKILLVSGDGSILLLSIESLHELSLANNEIALSHGLDLELEYCIIDISIHIYTAIVLPTRYEKK